MSIESVPVTMYRTSDNQMFDNANAAAAHQAVLQEQEMIEAYATAATDNEKGRSRLRTTLTEFVKWRATH